MDAETETLFRDTKVRWWLAVQAGSFVGWFGLASVLTIAGVDFLLILLVMVLLAFGVTLLIDPRRTWWGNGPTRVMADPDAMRRYRRLMTVWLLIAVVTGFVVVTLIVATGVVQPPDT